MHDIVEHVETLAKSQLDQTFQQPTAAFLSEFTGEGSHVHIWFAKTSDQVVIWLVCFHEFYNLMEYCNCYRQFHSYGHSLVPSYPDMRSSTKYSVVQSWDLPTPVMGPIHLGVPHHLAQVHSPATDHPLLEEVEWLSQDGGPQQVIPAQGQRRSGLARTHHSLQEAACCQGC